MTFVFSFWYIILALLIAGVVASILIFIKMDQKDRVLIDNFIKESTAEEKKEEVEKETPETKKE